MLEDDLNQPVDLQTRWNALRAYVEAERQTAYDENTERDASANRFYYAIKNAENTLERTTDPDRRANIETRLESLRSSRQRVVRDWQESKARFYALDRVLRKMLEDEPPGTFDWQDA